MSEWNIDDIIYKYIPSVHVIEYQPKNINLKRTKQTSHDDIQESYELMAKIVTEHGEEYLPIFARLHDELERQVAKRSMLSTAFKISNESDDRRKH